MCVRGCPGLGEPTVKPEGPRACITPKLKTALEPAPPSVSGGQSLKARPRPRVPGVLGPPRKAPELRPLPPMGGGKGRRVLLRIWTKKPEVGSVIKRKRIQHLPPGGSEDGSDRSVGVTPSHVRDVPRRAALRVQTNPVHGFILEIKTKIFFIFQLQSTTNTVFVYGVQTAVRHLFTYLTK